MKIKDFIRENQWLLGLYETWYINNYDKTNIDLKLDYQSHFKKRLNHPLDDFTDW